MKNKQEQEGRFLKWVEARDDDWWEDQARISIWDFRIMQEFFLEDNGVGGTDKNNKQENGNI